MNRVPVALVAALALGLALFPALSATAADAPPVTAPPITWSVQPSGATGNDGRESFAYSVDPGTEIQDYVSVSNAGTTAQTFHVYGTDAENELDTGAFGLLPAAQKPRDVGAWITTHDSEVTIGPGLSAIVPFVILVPSDATPGDHTAGVIASVTVKAADKSGQGVSLDQRVASRVYLRVSGQPISEVTTTGLVAGFSPSWNPFGGGNASVDFAVKNTGNVREDVAPSVVLNGPFGIQLGSAKAKPLINLLPGQDTQVHVELQGIAPLALLWATVKLKPGPATDLVAQSKLRDQNGTLVPALAQPKFSVASSTGLTAAISWTLLVLVLLVAGLIWLIVGYVRRTRDRMFDAIDAATEQAQLEAQNRASAAGAAPDDRTAATSGAPRSRS